MRKFTKDHNELTFLFPMFDNEKDAEQYFNRIEREAVELLELTYNKNTFTKDDMIDAYMKGNSKAMQYIIMLQMLKL